MSSGHGHRIVAKANVRRSATYLIDSRIGRLVEARVEWLNNASDVSRMEAALEHAFKQAGPGAIVCGDCRGIEVLPPEAGEALGEVFRRDNHRVERSAILLSPDSAIFNLQLDRLLREAANPARRAFRSSAPLLQWLGEVLRPDELQRAQRFLEG